MNNKQKFGTLDTSSKKELDLMEKSLKGKYENSKKEEKNSSKIA